MWDRLTDVEIAGPNGRKDRGDNMYESVNTYNMSKIILQKIVTLRRYALQYLK